MTEFCLDPVLTLEYMDYGDSQYWWLLRSHKLSKDSNIFCNFVGSTDFVQNLIVLFVYSKVFDCVLHNIVLQKLVNYGFKAHPYDFIKSYLTNKKQIVEYASKRSMVRGVIAGVPRSSKLRLFISLLMTPWHTVLTKIQLLCTWFLRQSRYGLTLKCYTSPWRKH